MDSGTTPSLCKYCSGVDLEEILDATSERWIDFRSKWVGTLNPQYYTMSSCGLCSLIKEARNTNASEIGPEYGQLWAAPFRHATEHYTTRRSKSPREESAICIYARFGRPDSKQRQPSYSALLGKVRVKSGSDQVNGSGDITVRVLKPTVDYQLLASWLSICKSHHVRPCGRSVPLVDGLNLIDCRSRKLVRAEERHNYVALSYVWGKGSEPMSKTDHKARVLPTRLSLVIEDAMIVTEKLGMRYLWVDQCCINQSDESEKEYQINRMNLIYERAEVTLIAAAGSDQSYGLPGVSSRARTPQPTAIVEGIALASSLQSPVDLVNNSKWSSRGWCYQEAILSKRRLVFTDEQVYFECEGIFLCESLAPRPYLFSQSGQRQIPGIFASGNDKTRYAAYWDHINQFSRRELTFSSDSLKALAGIAQRFYTKDAFNSLMGLPYVNLETLNESLSWCHKTSAVRVSSMPSWSWAGWSGELKKDSPSFRGYEAMLSAVQFGLSQKITKETSISTGIDYHEGIPAIRVDGFLLASELFASRTVAILPRDLVYIKSKVILYDVEKGRGVPDLLAGFGQATMQCLVLAKCTIGITMIILQRIRGGYERIGSMGIYFEDEFQAKEVLNTLTLVKDLIWR